MDEAQDYLDSLNDKELLDALEEAKRDCAIAAEEEKESEWHQACFAAVLTYGFEIQKRGLVTMH